MITQAIFNEWVNEYSDIIKEEIESRIIAEDAIDTGLMLSTVDYDLNGAANSYNLTFHIQDYGKFVDEGTVYITPREFYKKTIIGMANRFERFISTKKSKRQRLNVDSYVSVFTDTYGELQLQVSSVDRAKNTWWVLKINGLTDL
jgi:hypothetical protein